MSKRLAPPKSRGGASFSRWDLGSPSSASRPSSVAAGRRAPCRALRGVDGCGGGARPFSESGRFAPTAPEAVSRQEMAMSVAIAEKTFAATMKVKTANAMPA